MGDGTGEWSREMEQGMQRKMDLRMGNGMEPCYIFANGYPNHENFIDFNSHSNALLL